MGVCKPCTQKRLTIEQKRIYHNLEHKVQSTCSLTLSEIEIILNRLYCLKGKHPNLYKINNYIGQLEEMIALNNYCKYKLDKYFEILLKTEC